MSGSTPSTGPEPASQARGKGRIQVAAGALRDGAGRVLVTRRPEGAHQGGLWEFPGGKLEPGEPVQLALARELREELGIEVRSARPLIRIHHDYGDRQVLLDVFLVTEYTGRPRGLDNQALDWMLPASMDARGFPAADRPIIHALRLPERYLITGAEPRDEAAFLHRLGAAVRAGIEIVQLRRHDLADAEYAHLARAALSLCRAAGARLLLNPAPAQGVELARRIGADGLHLRAEALRRYASRPPVGGLVGASCHDGASLQRAAELGLDYALLGPVLPTATHPDAVPLGWAGFAALADTAVLPVYALGGMRPEHLAASFAHGAQGIAAIRAFW